MFWATISEFCIYSCICLSHLPGCERLCPGTMSYSVLCFLLHNTVLSQLSLNYFIDGCSGWNLRNSCGTEEEAFTVAFHNPVRILVVWLEQSPASPVLTAEMLSTPSTSNQAVSLWVGHVTMPTCVLISLHSLHLVPCLGATHIYMSPYPRPGQRGSGSKRPGPLT